MSVTWLPGKPTSDDLTITSYTVTGTPDSWSAATSAPSPARREHGQSTLPDGRIVITGGDGAGSEILDVDIWNPYADTILTLSEPSRLTSLTTGATLVNKTRGLTGMTIGGGDGDAITSTESGDIEILQ